MGHHTREQKKEAWLRLLKYPDAAASHRFRWWDEGQRRYQEVTEHVRGKCYSAKAYEIVKDAWVRESARVHCSVIGHPHRSPRVVCTLHVYGRTASVFCHLRGALHALTHLAPSVDRGPREDARTPSRRRRVASHGDGKYGGRGAAPGRGCLAQRHLYLDIGESEGPREKA